MQELIDIESRQFKQHAISLCPMRDIQSAKQKFLENLLTNLNTRFPDTDILAAFGVLSLRPIALLTPEDLVEWGNRQIQELANYFGQERVFNWKDEDGDHQKTSPALIDAQTTIKEWTQIKPRVVAQMYPTNSLQNLWALVATFHKEEFPNPLKLAQLALVCPIHTAGCERGFSVQNNILNSLRNRLSTETQDDLNRIKIEGGCLEDFNFDSALEQWRKKSRRLFMSK